MRTATVYYAKNHSDALAVKAILESEGIICHMPHEHLSGLVPYYSLSLGDYRLEVAESKAEKAMEVLSAMLDPEPQLYSKPEQAESPREPDSNVPCPACGSSETELVTSPRKGLIFTVFVLSGMPLALKKNRFICRECDYRWKV